MTRRKSSRRQKTSRSLPIDMARVWGWIKSPVAQQILAVGLIILSLLTLIALPGFSFTSGRWTEAWVRALRFLFGWGVVPVAVAIGLGGVLILQHHLEHPVAWRWRPVVGWELVFLGALALFHLVVGSSNAWGLVESGWGGGLVGWAISHLLRLYLGSWAAGLILLLAILIGLGLALDLTASGARNWFRQLVLSRRQSHSSPLPQQAEPRERPVRTTAAPARLPTPARETTTPHPTPSPTAAPSPAPPPAQPARPQPAPAQVAAVPLASAVAPDSLELPPLDLLEHVEGAGLSDEEVREKSRIIVETLSHFGLPVQVVEVRRGPTVTQFGIAPGFTERGGAKGAPRQHKVRVSQIASLADDLALALAAASLRVEAPVPGRSVVGIEVPNEEISLVTLRSVMESDVFQSVDAPLAIALGEDVAGSPVVADLGLMPHLLIAGTTGSGKSVCIKAIATCLAMNNRPDELQIVMIDPKMVELVRFNGLPHVLGHTEIELERISQVLRWIAHEMDERYKKFAAVGARHLDDYNQQQRRKGAGRRLPRIVVLIDELADLMMLAPDETERTICRIAQMARATGIHLVVATQRPSTDVVTGLIKANFPARISFATASQVDSRVILDMPGAETLLGQGDMLYLASDAGHPLRVQGCFVSEPEIEGIVSFWRQQIPEWPADAPWQSMVRGETESAISADGEEDDELLGQAIEIVRRRKTVSASYLQRQLRIGYPRAARLVEQLEEMGLVGPQEAAGRARRVIGGD
ncbi:MAG: DNA translocase FtsK [Anaerolineae bacterium]|nr:DNA translocase FtsK [Anaerolineae bacterium]